MVSFCRSYHFDPLVRVRASCQPKHQCDFPLWLTLRQNTAQDVGPVALKSMHNQQRCRRADLSLGCPRWCNEPRQTPEKVILLECFILMMKNIVDWYWLWRWLMIDTDDDDDEETWWIMMNHDEHGMIVWLQTLDEAHKFGGEYAEWRGPVPTKWQEKKKQKSVINHQLRYAFTPLVSRVATSPSGDVLCLGQHLQWCGWVGGYGWIWVCHHWRDDSNRLTIVVSGYKLSINSIGYNVLWVLHPGAYPKFWASTQLPESDRLFTQQVFEEQPQSATSELA